MMRVTYQVVVGDIRRSEGKPVPTGEATVVV
jgi:hypothetical protein